MKLTSKLILAFLVVSLFSTGIIVLITRVATNREFDRFISDQYKAELVEQLANHYQKNQTWEGLENNFKPFDNDHYKPGNDRPLFFSIADVNGKIVVAGSGHWLKDIVNARELDAGTPIQVEGETVGILLINSEPEKKSNRG